MKIVISFIDYFCQLEEKIGGRDDVCKLVIDYCRRWSAGIIQCKKAWNLYVYVYMHMYVATQ